MPRRSPLGSAASVAFLLVLFEATPFAQAEAVREAERLRNAGQMAPAAALLRQHLSRQPDDAAAAALLAQTLYWMQDAAGARAAYESAMQQHPTDDRLRLEYARMLAETGERQRARALLLPLRTREGGHAEATALLGTVAYWEGDLITAERLFSEALRLEPAHREASRQLQEIRTASRPWLRVAAGLWHDDQPLDRRTGSVEAGWFATPLTPIRVRLQPSQYPAARVTTVHWSGEAEVRHFSPATRIESELAGGMLRRQTAGGPSLEWTGRGALGLRLPGPVTVRGRLERFTYLYTLPSVRTSIQPLVAAGEVHLNHPQGWLAQAAVQRQRFPDGNHIHTTYGWLLAPVARGPGADLQAGYAFSTDDAQESRLVPDAFLATGDGRSISAGRYDPYYTPERLVRHSAIAAVTARLSPPVTLRAGGSYGFHAREDTPVFLRSAAGGTVLLFERRALSPWDLRASLDVDAGRAVAFGISAETGRGSFYEWTTAGVTAIYRFATRP